MKITTQNIKSPNYTENHELYVGTHTGSFKSKYNFLINNIVFIVRL